MRAFKIAPETDLVYRNLIHSELFDTPELSWAETATAAGLRGLRFLILSELAREVRREPLESCASLPISIA